MEIEKRLQCYLDHTQASLIICFFRASKRRCGLAV